MGTVIERSDLARDALYDKVNIMVDERLSKDTISNCILEIPQNIKVTLENNVLTLKAGSILVLANGATYTTVQLANDISRDISTIVLADNNKYIIICSASRIFSPIRLSRCASGNTLPANDDYTYYWYYMVDEKILYFKSPSDTTWRNVQAAYPICILTRKSGEDISFAKDSNNNDMIFNGMGFIGSARFIYPNIKALIPDGFNEDGSLKSIEYIQTSLNIFQIAGETRDRYITIGQDADNYRPYYEQEEQPTTSGLWYNPKTNILKRSTNNGVTWTQRRAILFGYAKFNENSQITDLTIRQPVRLATTEMLDKVQDQVDTKQDTLVSGTNIKTINSTSVLGSGNFTLADQSLSNLDSTGQMVVDTQNGTISNCILEIPQNLKLTLENNVLTLKAGSILTVPASVYTTVTTTQDFTRDYTGYEDGRYVVATKSSGRDILERLIGNCVSGAGATTTAGFAFDTTANEIGYYLGNGTKAQTCTYPFCIVDVVGGVASFAKDSNGNDMIFNGMGFIGHHIFTYPQTRYLSGNGYEDGKLASYNNTLNSLTITEMSSSTLTGDWFKGITVRGNNNSVAGSAFWRVVKSYDELLPQSSRLQFVEDDNMAYAYTSGSYQAQSRIYLCTYEYDGTTVTDFTIRQPVRLATTEMLDKVQDQVDTNTSDIAGKQDTLVSGTNIKTINSTSVLGSGNFTLADQSLSNLDSTGQMVIDSQNGTISNCILEIPQNIKLTLENNVLTLKSGSILVHGGSSYITTTTTSDKTWTPNSSQYNKTGLIFSARVNGAIQGITDFSKISSGTTAQRPAWSYSIRDSVYYDVDTKLFSYARMSSWNDDWEVAYPLCAVEVDSQGNVSFLKDSNGNDMIFNGVGFIGHHIFRLPNVSGYTGEGFTNDRKLNSNFYSPSNFLILEMSVGAVNVGKRCFGFQNATKMNYIEVDTLAESPAHQHIAWVYTYIREQNQIWLWTGSILVKQHESPLVYYNYNGTTVTDFTIRQPYEGARNLLTDDLEEQIDTKANDSDVLHKTGNETIAGEKTLTDKLTVDDNIVLINNKNTYRHIYTDNSAITKGTAPSATTGTELILRDSNNVNIGSISVWYSTGRACVSGLRAYNPQAGTTDNVSLQIHYDYSGATYATCPTPAISDDSNKIVTTEWFNDKLVLVNELPANPDSNVWYAIPESNS